MSLICRKFGDQIQIKRCEEPAVRPGPCCTPPTTTRKVFAIIHAQMISAPQLAAGESWALTRVMSPRSSVRVAGVDAYGEILNEYVSTSRVTGPVPGGPWAVYLAGADRRFRLPRSVQ